MAPAARQSSITDWIILLVNCLKRSTSIDVRAVDSHRSHCRSRASLLWPGRSDVAAASCVQLLARTWWPSSLPLSRCIAGPRLYLRYAPSENEEQERQMHKKCWLDLAAASVPSPFISTSRSTTQCHSVRRLYRTSPCCSLNPLRL